MGGVFSERGAVQRVMGVALVLLAAVAHANVGPSASVADALRYRLAFDSRDGTIVVAGDALHALPTLRRVYTERGFTPVWVGGSATRLDGMIATIRSSADHGLFPGDYHLDAIRELRGLIADGGGDAPTRADLDLLLTDSWLLLAAHLNGGRLDPTTVEPAWSASRSSQDLAARLLDAAVLDELPERLSAFAPPQPRYRRLRAAFAEYEAIARVGGWAEVPVGPPLGPGEVDPRVPAVRERLLASGDLAAPGDDADDLYTPHLAQAVRHFQRRHGLDADGIIGERTRVAMNVPAARRAEQLRANLERWRWLPQQLGEPHIEVNIPAYSMVMVSDGRSVLESEVIVGRDYRQTPVFSGRMTYLVFNPFWEIPPSIAVKDVLPRIREDVGYLERMGIEVLQGWGAREVPVDPATVDWATLSPSHFPYRLRQAPGARNALGRVKFMFPNRHSVYIHDTPARDLFARSRRDFSSGCIRTNRPEAVATFLLAANGDWPEQRVRSTMAAGGETRTVKLARPVDVHLLYWSAWADSDGTVHFREDIYDRDPRVLAGLAEPPRASIAEAGQ